MDWKDIYNKKKSQEEKTKPVTQPAVSDWREIYDQKKNDQRISFSQPAEELPQPQQISDNQVTFTGRGAQNPNYGANRSQVTLPLQVQLEADMRNLAAQMQQRDREQQLERAQNDATHSSGKFDDPAEEEKQSSFGDLWRDFWADFRQGNATAARLQAEEITNDEITPMEAAALGAARVPMSIGTTVAKALSSATKDEEDDQRVQDMYEGMSGMVQQAQQTQGAAYGAGQILGDVATMNAISGVVSPLVGKAATAIGTMNVGVNGANAVMQAGRAAQTIINGAASVISSALTFGIKDAITEAGSFAMGDQTAGEYFGGIGKGAASGAIFSTVSAVLSAGGTGILRGLNNRFAGGKIDWTAPFAWFTKEVISGMGGASASIGFDYATAKAPESWKAQMRAQMPGATDADLDSMYKEEMKKDLGKQFLMMFFFTVMGAAKSTSQQLDMTREAMGITEDFLKQNFSDDIVEKASRYAFMTPEEKAAFAREIEFSVNAAEAQLESLGGRGYYGVGLNSEMQRIYSALENIRGIVTAPAANSYPMIGEASAAYDPVYEQQLVKMITDGSVSSSPEAMAQYAAQLQPAQELPAAQEAVRPEAAGVNAVGALTTPQAPQYVPPQEYQTAGQTPQDMAMALMEQRLNGNTAQSQEIPQNALQTEPQRGTMENHTTASETPAEADKTALEPIAKTLGENGSKALTSQYDGSTPAGEYAEEFVQVYNAAKNGEAPPETTALTEAQRYAATAAGKNDAPKAEEPKAAAQKPAPAFVPVEDRKTTKAKMLAAAKRTIKMAISTQKGRSAIHGAWIGGDGRQYMSSAYYAVALNNPIEGLQQAQGMPQLEQMIASAKDTGKTLIQLPSAEEVKAITKNGSELSGGGIVRYTYDDGRRLIDFGTGLPQVNADYLKTVLELVPDAVGYASSETAAIYFTGKNGDGIILPVRKMPKETKGWIEEEYENGKRKGRGSAGNGTGSLRDVAERPGQRTGGVDQAAAGDRAAETERRVAEGSVRGDGFLSGKAADKEAGKLSFDHDPVSAKDFGMKKADTGKKVYTVASGTTPSTRNAEKILTGIGAKSSDVTFFGGGTLSAGGNDRIEAFCNTKTGQIGLPVDHEHFTSDRFAGHEGCELLIAKGKVKPEKILKAVRRTGDSEALDHVVNMYQKMYPGASGTTKELVCDAAGLINRLAVFDDGSERMKAEIAIFNDVLNQIHGELNRQMDDAFSSVPAIGKTAVGDGKYASLSEMPKAERAVQTNDGFEFSMESPFVHNSEAERLWAATLSPEARETFDLFSDLHDIGLKNKAMVMVDQQKNPHKKLIDVTTRNMLAAEWNGYIKENPKFAETARLLAERIPESIRKEAHINPDGSITPTAFENRFKMMRSFMQRIVDALPNTVMEPTVEIDGKTVKLSDKAKINCIGGEPYRQALIAERRAQYEDGTLRKKSIAGLSKDTWGTLGFLATNTKTVASGDFTTFCPQMMFNNGCWYCYRLAALTSGMNNKLVAEKVFYTGEILRLKKEDIERLNRTGGLRIQSFGDWLDMYSAQFLDLLRDAAKVGLQLKIITKEPSMIHVVAMLKEQGFGENLYFNISADYGMEEAPAGAVINPERPFARIDGKLYWKRALTVEEANELRKKYPWVNTRIVATNTEEFIRGLKDPWVDVVTGYHGKLREMERVSTEDGQKLSVVEPLGDNGMPRFAYNPQTKSWITVSEGRTKVAQNLCKRIVEEGLQYQYYVKTCCQTGRCAECEGKCGKLAKDFNIKNATNRDKDSVKFWQRVVKADPDQYPYAHLLTDEQFDELKMISTGDGKEFARPEEYSDDPFAFSIAPADPGSNTGLNREHPEVETGLNFRDPTGTLLERVFNKEKLYETRDYNEKRGHGKIPGAYLNKLQGMVQTGDGKAKMVGYWQLGDGVLREFDWLDTHKAELGNDGTEFEAKPGDRKWVYPITNVERIDSPREVDTIGQRARRIAPTQSGDTFEHSSAPENPLEGKTPAQINKEYLELAKDPEKNGGKLEEIIHRTAEERGYEPLNLYHGTNNFGFTEFDLEKGDGTIFLTDNVELSEIYSKGAGVRTIKGSGITMEQAKAMPVESLIERANKNGGNYHIATKAEINAEIARLKGQYSDIVEKVRSFFNDNGISGKDANKLISCLEDMADSRNFRQYNRAVGKYYALEDSVVYDRDDISTAYYKAVGESITQLNNRIGRIEEETGRKTITNGEGRFYSPDSFIGVAYPEVTKNGIYQLFGKKGRNLSLECDGAKWDELTYDMIPDERVAKELAKKYPNASGYTTRMVCAAAIDAGYNSATFKDVLDPAVKSNITAFFSSEQVKSADLVTYDDDGEVIPPSRRFLDKDPLFKNDIRYSTAPENPLAGKTAAQIDKEYLELAKDPESNRDALQKIVDEEAKNSGAFLDSDGTPKRLYHGTKAEFTVFDRNAPIKNGRIYGAGIYLTDSKERLKYYSSGGRVISSYVIADNIATMNDHRIDSYSYDSFIGMLEDYGITVDASKINYDVDTIAQLKGTDFLDRDDASIIGLTSRSTVIPEDMSGEDFCDIFGACVNAAFGYDAISLTDEYVVWDNSKIKSADPVTYDDNGNVIPLSERFNSSNNDIRYSTAPENPLAPTFYSQMSKTIEDIKQQKLGASSVVSYLRGRGVKAEEIKWSGIEAWLDGKKSVTKEELQAFAAASQLEIEETTLTNDEIPYTPEQQKQIAGYESERSAIVDELKKAWQEEIGAEFPIANPGAGLENMTSDRIDEYSQYLRQKSDIGQQMSAVRNRLKEIFEEEDFGYDSAKKAYMAAVRDPMDFIKSYDLTDDQRTVLEEYASLKEQYKNQQGVPEAVRGRLLEIASRADKISSEILKIRNAHYKEAAKHMTKWGEYKTRGGENYREVLFRLPGSDYSNQAMSVHWRGSVAEGEGVLAHARLQDFDTDSGRMLFVEEIQSDWHNAGNKYGYENRNVYTEENTRLEFEMATYTLFDENDEILGVRIGSSSDREQYLAEMLAHANAMQEQEYVPDAPFRDTYTDFVMKRLIRMAAENDYDSIGWTTAQQQSDRWSDAYAEGYRIEYDQDIPKFMNKYGKKWGAKVEQTQLENGDTVWKFKIPEAMKESVLYEGQAQYSTAPKVNPLTGDAQKEETQNAVQMPRSPDRWETDLTAGGKKVKKPMPLSDIVAKVQHDYGFNITSGHVRGAGVRGTYNPNDKGIRVRLKNNLPTISHELGHGLDYRYQIIVGNQSMTKALSAELERCLGPMKNAYDERLWNTEGFAEYLRKFLTNSEKACTEYPEITKAVKSKLSGKDRVMLEAFADQINAYYAAASKDASDVIRNREDKGADFRTPVERIADMGEHFRQQWIDSNEGIRAAEIAMGGNGKAYTLATNSAYSSNMAASIITGDLTDANGQYVGEGLKTALAGVNTRNKKEYAHFGEYLVCRHGPERLARGMDVFANDIQNDADWMNNRAAELEKQYPAFKDAADRVIDFERRFNETWCVGYGLMEKEMFDEWKKLYPNHVPLNRVMDKGRGGRGAKRGYANQTNPHRRAKGSTRDIINPVDNIMDEIIRVVNTAVRNNVMLALRKAALGAGADANIMEKIPTPMAAKVFRTGDVKQAVSDAVWGTGLSTTDKMMIEDILFNIEDTQLQFERKRPSGDIVTVLVKGKPEYWKVNDPLLLQSIANIAPAKLNGILEAYGTITRFMTANITGNNAVWSIFSNMPRDLMTFINYTKDKSKLPKAILNIGSTYLNSVKEYIGVGSVNPLYMEYLALGGFGSSAYSADRDMAKKARKQLTQSKAGRALDALNPINFVSFLTDTIELGPRFATYKTMRESGLGPQEAFYEAMDITVNFRKAGIRSREVNKAFPFFNASVQGIDKFGRYFSGEDQAKNGSKARAKTVASRWGFMIASSAIIAAINYALNQRDDEKEKDYQQLSSYTKNSYYVIPLGDGKYFAIPKPRELAVLTSLMEATIDYAAKDNEHAFDEFYEYAVDQFFPSVVSDLLQLPTNIQKDGVQEGTLNTAFDMVGEAGLVGIIARMAANRDFLGRPIQSEYGNIPPKDQWSDNTSKIAYWMGQAFGFSPKMVDYFGNNVLGYIWKYQQALLPVNPDKRDLTLGVHNSYFKDNQYSTDITNWLYDNRDKSAMAAAGNKTDMQLKFDAALADRMTKFYSYFNKLNRLSGDKGRDVRQNVLDMIYDYRDYVEGDAVPRPLRVLQSYVKKTGETELLPAVMNTYVQDAAGRRHNLNDKQYYEFQTQYLNNYYRYIEQNVTGTESMKEMEAILTAAKKIARDRASQTVMNRYFDHAESDFSQKYPGVSDGDLVQFMSQVDLANNDGSLKQAEVIEIIDAMIVDGLSYDDAYTLFHSRYDSDRNNPYVR